MRSTTLIIALLLCIPLFAQKGKRDVVYLKNGSVLRGTIVLQDPGKMIKLKTSDNSLWVFRYDQIDSITKPVRVRVVPKEGYYNLTEIGLLAGNYSNATRAPFSLINISSWYFPCGFSAGVGVGVEFSHESYMPVVGDIRYIFTNKRTMPFVSVQSGFSIPMGGSYSQTIYAINDRRVSPLIWSGPIPAPANNPISARGGFLINPAIGIQTPLNENLAFTFSLGYRYMRYSYHDKENYRLDIDFNRLSIKAGIIFK